MAWSGWPFDTIDTTETQYSILFRILQITGVVGVPTGTTLKTFADSTGLTVKVPAGDVFIRGHYGRSTSQDTLTIVPGESQARIDAIVARLDPALNTITSAVVKGTAGTTPVAPTLQKTDAGVYELLLATVAVGANASTITAANVVDKRTFVGQEVGVWSTANRATSNPPAWFGFNTTTNKPEFWDGDSWESLTGNMEQTLANMDTQIDLLTALIGGHKINVQSTQPSGGSTNDLWFW